MCDTFHSLNNLIELFFDEETRYNNQAVYACDLRSCASHSASPTPSAC